MENASKTGAIWRHGPHLDRYEETMCMRLYKHAMPDKRFVPCGVEINDLEVEWSGAFNEVLDTQNIPKSS